MGSGKCPIKFSDVRMNKSLVFVAMRACKSVCNVFIRHSMIQKMKPDASDVIGADINEAEVSFSPHCKTCTCSAAE
jgi:hypothetical protein